MEQVHLSHTRRGERDSRIDFWRGLCLIDMILVHLGYNKVQFGSVLEPFICDYLRFAAGGFVFMAGMAVGFIYLPKARAPERRMQTYCRLWLRSIQLAAWQFFLCLGWIVMQTWEGNRNPEPGLWRLFLDVLSMRDGGDLLPFYMMLIAVAPLLLEMCRRKWGVWLLPVMSIGVFALGRIHPYWLAMDPQGTFPPLLWQLVFVAGLLAGINLTRYDALKARVKVLVLAAALLMFGLLFWCEFWSAVGLPPCPVSLVFSKTPLTTGEMLRYLSLVTVVLVGTDLIWRRISRSGFAAFSGTLGKCTLQVYVAQVFLMELAGIAATQWWWRMGAWQILFAPVCLGMLWVLAAALQWRRQREKAGVDWSILFGSPVRSQIGE